MPRTPGVVARRDAIRTLAASALAGVGVSAFAPVCGCRRAPDPPPQPPSAGSTAATPGPKLPKAEPVRVPLRDLPLRTRTTVPYGDAQVELFRDGAGVEARLLLCTHMGCPVAWSEERQSYACPCHGGGFDAAGEPIAGPPTSSLLRVPTRVEAGTVVVGSLGS